MVAILNFKFFEKLLRVHINDVKNISHIVFYSNYRFLYFK